MTNIQSLLRDNIRNLKPYSSARDEYTGDGGILLDANENPIGSAVEGPFNRYPDPRQRQLKSKLAALHNLEPGNIFLGNGSDEAIDLLFRAFCNPGRDQVIILPPTYGMYRVCAGINDVDVLEVQLTKDFQPDADRILAKAGERTKLLFLCSPNNPTGNTFDREKVETLIAGFPGIVVVDEAYIDFSAKPSLLNKIMESNNLVILQTMSKAWGMAGLRLGMAYASSEIIDVLNRIKPPYNVNILTQKLGLDALNNIDKKEKMVKDILSGKDKIFQALQAFTFVDKIYPSDTNYLLVKVNDPEGLYRFLFNENIIVRNRSNVVLCEGCLRITIGTGEENQLLLKALNRYNSRMS